jgi:hypothetical protein
VLKTGLVTLLSYRQVLELKRSGEWCCLGQPSLRYETNAQHLAAMDVAYCSDNGSSHSGDVADNGNREGCHY